MKQVDATGDIGAGPGAHGFGEREAWEEPPLALGHVTGVRMFDFGGMAPGRTRAALTYYGSEQLGELTGNYGGAWADGENAATCQRGGHRVPADGCGCGFWAYWTAEDAHRVWRPTRPVLAVVEGYGPTRIGDIGFRCAVARIVAVAVVFDFYGPGGEPAMSQDGWHEAFGHDWRIAGTNDHLLALCEDVLERRYPSVRVYSTTSAMLARHPTTTDYLPDKARQQRWPGPGRQVGISAATAMQALNARVAEATGAVRALTGQVVHLMPCVRCGDHTAPIGQALCPPCAAMIACPKCGDMFTRAAPGSGLCDRCNRLQGMSPIVYARRLTMPKSWPGKIINC